MAIEIPSINLTAPKITCSLNDKLNTLNSKKDALKDSIKNLASIEINSLDDLSKLTSAFSSVQDRVESLKTSLKDAIPIPPEVENFQAKMKEFTNLAATAEGRVNAEIYKQVDDLKKKFTSSVPGLSNILKQTLQGGAQIDICSLPNVDLIPSDIPGLPPLPKIQPPAALIPTEIPKVVIPKPPTIVKKVEQKTSGVVNEKPAEAASSLDEYTTLFRESFGSPFFKAQFEAQQKVYAAEKGLKKYIKRAKKAGYESGFQAWENGFDDPDDGKYTEFLKLYNDFVKKEVKLIVAVKVKQGTEKIMFKEGLKTAAEFKARPAWPNRKYRYVYNDIESRKQIKIVVTAEDTENIKLFEEVVDFVASNYDKWHPHYKLAENTDK